MHHIEEKDLKLTAKENSYARVYTISRILLALTLIGALGIAITDRSLESELYDVAMIFAVVWLVIFSYAKSKLEHIESIKYYRKIYGKNN